MFCNLLHPSIRIVISFSRNPPHRADRARKGPGGDREQTLSATESGRLAAASGYGGLDRLRRAVCGRKARTLPTRQRINLINLLDKGGPGEPGAAAEGLVIGGGQGGGAAGGGEALIVRCGGNREASCRSPDLANFSPS